jgi:hypothetical protein
MRHYPETSSLPKESSNRIGASDRLRDELDYLRAAYATNPSKTASIRYGTIVAQVQGSSLQPRLADQCRSARCCKLASGIGLLCFPHYRREAI